MRQVWGADAAVFKPERWENDGSPPHRFAYLPFASGARGCIGKEFSLIEQKIGLVCNRTPSVLQYTAVYHFSRSALCAPPPAFGMFLRAGEAAAALLATHADRRRAEVAIPMPYRLPCNSILSHPSTAVPRPATQVP